MLLVFCGGGSKKFMVMLVQRVKCTIQALVGEHPQPPMYRRARRN
jgi:hypothetical protein